MPELRRSLSLFDLTMIAIGSTIGSGIFLTPALIAKELPSPFWIIGVWVVGGLMALSGALTFAELGSMMPRAGGVYVFLSQAYGGLVGFLFGWAYFLVVNTGAIAALAVAFSTYFGFLVPLNDSGQTAVAISGIVFVTFVNILGVKVGGIFSDVFTLLKLVGILFLIIVGFGWGSTSTTDFSLGLSSNNLSGALTIAFVSVLWSYGGWQHVTFTAAEAKDPKTSVPFALVLATLVVGLVYVSTNIAYMLLLSPADMASSQRIASDAVSVALGPVGGTIIALTIFISTFGTAGIYTLTAPRIYYAMANDGLFFKKVAEVHPRYHTPVNAILIQSAWAIVLILFWRTFDRLISYVVFTDWIFFALTAASVFVFRKRLPDAERPYKTVAYPFPPIFFIAVATWFVINTLMERPQEAWAGLGFLALGVPVYYFWKRRK
ncbi:MAG: amino acid permease [Ignavibacteriales bacterium]|nr:amino acid permease [Ignavibacteriales bacterium]